MKNRFDGKEDDKKVAQVETILDGGQIHHIFCNQSVFRKAEECPTCKDLYLTQHSTPEDFWV